MSELKTCPFCGSDKLHVEMASSYYGKRLHAHFAVCENDNCGAEGPHDLSESGAVEKWNAAPRVQCDALLKEKNRLFLALRSIHVQCVFLIDLAKKKRRTALPIIHEFHEIAEEAIAGIVWEDEEGKP